MGPLHPPVWDVSLRGGCELIAAQQLRELDAMLPPISQIRRLRLREGKQIALVHTER